MARSNMHPVHVCTCASSGPVHVYAEHALAPLSQERDAAMALLETALADLGVEVDRNRTLEEQVIACFITLIAC